MTSSITRLFQIILPLVALGNSFALSAAEQRIKIHLGEAADYNVFVFNDFSAPSSKVEGRLAVGGNLDIDGYSLADKLPEGDQGYTLLVGGNANFPTGRIYQGHSLISGNGTGIGDAVRFGLSEQQVLWDNVDLPINFTQTKNQLIRLSLQLSAWPLNGEVTYQWGGVYLSGDCQSDLQVFNIDGDALLKAHTFKVTCLPQNAHVVFNISGNAPGLKNLSFQDISGHRNRVLFNFYEANSLSLRGVYVEGSVLAPHADIGVPAPSGTVHGSLIANSWQGSMSFSHQPFKPYNGHYVACEGKPM